MSLSAETDKTERKIIKTANTLFLTITQKLIFSYSLSTNNADMVFGKVESIEMDDHT